MINSHKHWEEHPSCLNLKMSENGRGDLLSFMNFSTHWSTNNFTRLFLGQLVFLWLWNLFWFLPTFSALTGIFDHLLRMPLNPERESWIETLLGCFYAPQKPWAKNTMLLFKEPLSRYARRFFHHLLRYSR